MILNRETLAALLEKTKLGTPGWPSPETGSARIDLSREAPNLARELLAAWAEIDRLREVEAYVEVLETANSKLVDEVDRMKRVLLVGGSGEPS